MTRRGLDVERLARQPLRHDRAAVRPLEQPPALEVLEVAPDRHLGDAELLRERRDTGRAMLLQELLDPTVPLGREQEIHRDSYEGRSAGAGTSGPANTQPFQ